MDYSSSDILICIAVSADIQIVFDEFINFAKLSNFPLIHWSSEQLYT